MLIASETARYKLSHLNLYCLQNLNIAIDAERVSCNYHIIAILGSPPTPKKVKTCRPLANMWASILAAYSEDSVEPVHVISLTRVGTVQIVVKT